MGKTIRIDYTKPMLDKDGEPFRNYSKEEIHALGITTDQQLLTRKEEFPTIGVQDILDQLMDIIPLASNSIFALYSDILTNMRAAKKENLDYIDVTEQEYDKILKLFEKGLDGKPEFNRKIAFIYNELKISFIASASAPPSSS